jgi:alpha-tubulin suppressor-like RCC1 family protein
VGTRDRWSWKLASALLLSTACGGGQGSASRELPPSPPPDAAVAGDSGPSNNVAPDAGAGADAMAQQTGPLLAQSIAVGTNHGCAVLDGGQVACWGSRDWGQLGDGTSSGSGGPPSRPGAAVLVAGLSSVSRVVIGSGSTCMADGSCGLEDTTCAILGDGTVQCWGMGAHGELGNGREGMIYFEPRPVAAMLSGVVDLAIGNGAGCAALGDGSVSCWGNNTGRLGFMSPQCGPYYQFATDTQPPPAMEPCQATPRGVSGIAGAARVAVGGLQQCVLNQNASAACWSDAPVGPVSGLNATAIAVGHDHLCALLPDGSIDCWGDDSSGQLGLGSGAVNQGRFAAPTPVPGLSNVKAIRLAGDTSVALLADGTGMAWGDVSYVLHTAPDPTSVAAVSPTKIDWAVDDATDIQSSHFLTCALRRDRSVWCRDSSNDYAVSLQTR